MVFSLPEKDNVTLIDVSNYGSVKMTVHVGHMASESAMCSIL